MIPSSNQNLKEKEMTKKQIHRVAIILFLVGVLILTIDSYLKATAGIKTQIQQKEHVYAKGNFDYYKSKDSQDKNSKALYWYVQTLKIGE